MDTSVVAERVRFVQEFAGGEWTLTELCERFQVTRPTGYKWVARFREGGAAALADASRAPHHSPQHVDDEVVRLLVAARRKYGWGAGKLLALLRTRHPRQPWPARSTANAILERRGLLERRRRRRHWTHPGAPPLTTTAPNGVWPADFKGEFRVGDGQECFGLTLTDHYSRYLLVCHGLPSTKTRDTQPVFRRVFRAVGLPEAIRTDNGLPFASHALHGLSALNVWWMQLGIVHQRIPPGCPQANGQHERLHRDLKRETTRPPARTLRGQQRRFDGFRARYNDERPHEALGNRTPSSLWTPSTRPYPETVPSPEYPGHLVVRRVSTAGTFCWHSRPIFLSETLSRLDIGFEAIDDGVWNIVFYRTLLGRFDERTGQITSG
jgi:transposase InsO family protein